MSLRLPDIILDVAMATGSPAVDQKDKCSRTSTDSGMATSQGSCSEKTISPELPSPTSSRSTPSSRSHRSARSRCSMISVDSCDSDCIASLDEGEAAWDALGRMNSVRRSNRFDKPRLLTLSLARGPDGFGLELGGRSPPTIVDVFGDAKGAGIRPGDQLLEVNGFSVRGAGHKEAGKLMAESSDSVTVLIHSVKPAPTPDGQVIYSGWLMKRGGSGMTPRNWRRRWFVVRDDCIAYYYSSASDNSPMGAIVLRNYTVSKACHDVRKPFAFKMVKGGARSYYFSADNEQEMNKWAQVFTEAATLEGRESVHFSGAAHNVSLSALAIKDPDCHGWMHKQGHGIKTWKRRYCVLKSHQLFYYGKMSHTTAYGVMNLRGYRIEAGKTKDKKYCFQALPPVSTMREFRFYTESDGERERWMEAMCKSISAAN